MMTLIAVAWLTTLAQAGTPPLMVGSNKRFTVSDVLAKLVRQRLQQAGVVQLP